MLSPRPSPRCSPDRMTSWGGTGAGSRRPSTRSRRSSSTSDNAGEYVRLMKIVSVLTSTSSGGAEFAVVELLDALAELGHEAVLL